MLANLCLMLDVDVQSGKQVASKHSAPGLWAMLSRIPREHWPALIRGDRDGTLKGIKGTEANMRAAEQTGIAYL